MSAMGDGGLCAHHSTQANNGSYAIPARGQLWDLVVASATLRAGTPLPARPARMNGSTVAAIPERKVAGAVLRVLGLACHCDGACFASEAAAGHRVSPNFFLRIPSFPDNDDAVCRAADGV